MTEAAAVRALVVDGDPAVRQAIVEALNSRGVQVVGTAMGCRTGLPKIESYRPDVVLVDLITDSVEGVDLLGQIREHGLPPRLVAMGPSDGGGPRAARARSLGALVVDRPTTDGSASLSTLADVVSTSQRLDGAAPPRAARAAADGDGRRASVAERSIEKPAEKPAEKPVGRAAEKPAERAERTTERHADRATERPVERGDESRTARQRPRPTPGPDADEAAGTGAASVAAPPRRVAATARTEEPAPAPRASPPVATSVRRGSASVEVVAIGISTGGPKALSEMLPMMPADLRVPVLIVQHMPPVFTASLAESLSRRCPLPVREAAPGEPIRPGQVLIAPGGRHLKVVRGEQGIVVRITEDPPECSCRPSVDYLFRSLAEVYGSATCAVMMTGMGEDGFAGCRLLHQKGAVLIAQDAASCTVYGMPRGPIEAGIVHHIEPLERIASRIASVVKGERA